MNVKYIIIHHSFTEDGKVVDWQAIRNYHLSLGWKDIGYHFGIELINNNYEILVGRQLDEIGAHTFGLNSISLGICLIGNFDDKEPNPNQLSKAVVLVRALLKIFNLGVENVIGHRETYILYKRGMISYDVLKENVKSCPGFQFSMKKFREIVSKDENIRVLDKSFLNELNDFDEKVLNQRKIFWI